MAKIMAVEDERIVALHLQQQLVSLGYEVVGLVASGDKALQTISQTTPDLILMDIHIEGGIDGIETAARIPPELEIPVIYLTAYAEDATLDRARATRPYGYLLKPYSERELHATIQMALERRAVQQALRDSEDRFRSIFAAVGEGIFIIDPTTGVLTQVNETGATMFGHTTEELTGVPITAISAGEAPYTQDELAARIEQAAASSEAQRFEWRCSERDGRLFWAEFSLRSGVIGSREVVLSIIRDLTERKRAEEQRERFVEQLVASNEEKGHFAHVAAHDLREPLRMMTAFCGLLSKDYGERLDMRGQEYLSLALSSGARMQELLDDLVEFGRLGQEAERRSWFDANQSLERVLENLRDAIRESEAEVICGTLPRLYGNPIRFIRLTQNLIGNALKYVAPGVEPRVEVSALREGACWRFCVADNGIGVEPRHHQRIFEPFKRLHGRDHYSGTGLGLAICRKIVDGFGGRIWVDSELGHGAVFNFTVPAADELARPH